MADRLFQVDYSDEEGFTVRFHPMKFRLLPKEAREHFRTANREALLAFRSMIDSYVGGEGKSSGKARTKIKVE